MQTVNVPRELLEAIMALEWNGPLKMTCYLNLDLLMKQKPQALPHPSVEACRSAFKAVPKDEAYDLLNELTVWHEVGRYE